MSGAQAGINAGKSPSGRYALTDAEDPDIVTNRCGEWLDTAINVALEDFRETL